MGGQRKVKENRDWGGDERETQSGAEARQMESVVERPKDIGTKKQSDGELS